MQGVSSRGRRSFTGLSFAGLLLAAASGCSNSDAGSRVAAKATVSGPEQVVQRIAPTPVAPADVVPAPAALPSASPTSAGVASGAAAAAPAEASKSSGEPAVNVEPITSKHLEAELNRLEAELR